MHDIVLEWAKAVRLGLEQSVDATRRGPPTVAQGECLTDLHGQLAAVDQIIGELSGAAEAALPCAGDDARGFATDMPRLGAERPTLLQTTKD